MINTILAIGIMALFSSGQGKDFTELINSNDMLITEKNMRDVATFGAGCFWCVEAIFQDLNGVNEVVSGYSGGHVKNPTYAEVCTGNTGHAEVCQIYFNPGIISYRELLDVFWRTHDPTTLNRQGVDVGTQYRSVIFFHDEEQREQAEESKKEIERSGLYKNPVVTEITPFQHFYPADEYHQDYFNQNPNQPYCQFTIDPKVKKFRKQFKEMIR
jgi:peptide-methionine (S)-S-oxide reductase